METVYNYVFMGKKFPNKICQVKVTKQNTHGYPNHVTSSDTHELVIYQQPAILNHTFY